MALREEDLPIRVVVGANGAYWREWYGGDLSMCPVSEDNEPVVIAAVYVRDYLDPVLDAGPLAEPADEPAAVRVDDAALRRALESLEALAAWYPFPDKIRKTESIRFALMGLDAEVRVRSLRALDIGSEFGRLLAERDRLIASGVDPADLETPEPPRDAGRREHLQLTGYGAVVHPDDGYAYDGCNGPGCREIRAVHGQLRVRVSNQPYGGNIRDPESIDMFIPERRAYLQGRRDALEAVLLEIERLIPYDPADNGIAMLVRDQVFEGVAKVPRWPMERDRKG